MALAGVFALAVLATSFPLSSLLSQHHQLSAASAQLQQVQKENRALTEQRARPRLQRGRHPTGPGRLPVRLAGPDPLRRPPSVEQDRRQGHDRHDRSGIDRERGSGGPAPRGSGERPGPQCPGRTAAPADPVVGGGIPAVGRHGHAGTCIWRVDSATRTGTTFWGRVSQTLQFWK